MVTSISIKEVPCSNMFKYVLIFILVVIRYSYGRECEKNNYNPNQQTETSTCMAWGSYNLKTFDDNGFSFRTDCPMTLISFKVGTTEFKIDVGKSSKTCRADNCYTYIDILFNGVTYRLGRSATNVPIFTDGKNTHFIPVELPGISVVQPGIRVVVELARLGVVIKWDEKNMVEVSIENNKQYDVLGLCGNNDKCSSNDLVSRTGAALTDIDTFLDDWKASTACSDTIDTQSTCKGNKFDIAKAEKACEILTDARFAEANKMLDPGLYKEACVSAYCSCPTKNINCLCETLDVYAKASISAGVTKVLWRDAATCEKKCDGNLKFLPCALKGGLQTCNGIAPVTTPGGKCEEGCYCNAAQYFFKGNCYIKKNCPCSVGATTLQPGETIIQNCHTCVCKNGVIDCPKTPCLGPSGGGGGDPHYTTFDGKKFDFMGKCVYYLVRGPNFTIESDQYGWEGGQFSKTAGGPSYIRRLIIKTEGDVVELKPDKEVVFNDVQITRFPLKEDSMLITKPSDSYVVAELSNYVQVQWDGNSNVLVRLPTTMEGRVDGLLGTYSGDASDDFVKPDGEIANDPLTFGNSWKTELSCGNHQGDIVHPCVANPSAKAEAERICSIIKSTIFNKCEIEEYNTDYENCVYDTCFCKEPLAKCACDSISMFADKCGKKGISIAWRDRQPQCKPTCPAGQVYQVCNSGCARTCEDISLRPECPKMCIEGCNCPSGQTMDEDGKCIPVSQCKCRIDGIAYPPGFKICKSEEELLTCKDAKWVVSIPSPEDLQNIPSIDDLNKKCTIKNSVFSPCKNPTMKTCQNMHIYETTSVAVCEPGCECKDGYAYEPTVKACIKRKDCPCYEKRRSYDEGAVILRDECNRCVCVNGFWKCKQEDCELLCKPNDVKKIDCNTCACKDAYWVCTQKKCCTKEHEAMQVDCNTCVCINGVWRCTNNICVHECEENTVKEEDCKICTCQKGKWECDDTNCVEKCEKEDEIQFREFGKCVCKNGKWKCVDGQCNIWSYSHIDTFDGVRYKFNGDCSYVLVKGKLRNQEFQIDISNEICSNTAATCLKSFTISVNIGGVIENITFIKESALPNTENLKKLILKDRALYITVEVVGAGIEVFWDKKIWVNVKLDGKWQRKVSGLCGNYNRRASDDLEVSGERVNVKEAYRFAELWKRDNKCKMTNPN